MSKSRGPYMCSNGHLLGERVYFTLTGCRRCRENERRRAIRERLRHERKTVDVGALRTSCFKGEGR